MATMPAGATMNLDGSKPYYLASLTNSTRFGTDADCGIYVGNGQTLDMHGAVLTPSPSM